MFLYDYLLTIGREIKLVWFSRWNVIKIAFLIQRYLPFVDGVLLGMIGE
jgi:hypothetical protein